MPDSMLLVGAKLDESSTASAQTERAARWQAPRRCLTAWRQAWLIGLALMGAVMALTPQTAAAAEHSSSSIPISPDSTQLLSTPPPIAAERLRQTARSVVKVAARIVPDGSTVGALGRSREGSGIVLDPTTVLTIGYLVVESESVEVETASGKRLPATLTGYDHATGFGLLRVLVPVDAPPAPLGNSDAVIANQLVLTAGFGERESTPVLAVSRQPFAGGWEYLLESPIFTFPPVNNWSGSALFDSEGHLVGVGSLVVDDARAVGRKVPGNMFVPINLLKPILADLQERGKRSGPVQPWLGLTTEWRDDALIVVRVSPRGPADRAGIADGDQISAVADVAITDQADFYRKVMAGGPAGSALTLTVKPPAAQERQVQVRSIDRTTFLKQPAGI